MALLVLSGLLLLALAAIDALLLRTLFPPEATRLVGNVQAGRFAFAARLAAAGAALLLAAWAARRTGLLGRLARRRWATNALLAALSLAAGLCLLETLLRPFFPPLYLSWPATTIFQPDEERGWKLRPGATDRWGGVEVQINSDGLRGPLCPREKPEKEWRVLCLGDSVTFGYCLEEEQSFPHVLEGILAAWAPPGRSVRVINAGVEGYSTWQELELLRRQGLGYRPDAVVLAFVLNDVTEMYGLRLFGGAGEGFQLQHARRPGALDGSLDAAARLLRGFSTATALRRLYHGARLGPGDPQQAAKRMEELGVLHLLTQPDSPLVRRAWERALADVKAIADLAEGAGCHFLLVAFPHRFQLEDSRGTAGPQATLREFASRQGLGMLDLLPHYLEEMKTGWVPERLFFDELHPSFVGQQFAAIWIAQALWPLWTGGEGGEGVEVRTESGGRPGTGAGPALVTPEPEGESGG